MKYCTACGNQLPNEIISFCSNCGYNLQPIPEIAKHSSPADQVKPAIATPLPMQHNSEGTQDYAIEPVKKKIKPAWFIALFLLISIISVMIYGVYEKSFYPKSQGEVYKHLLDKYWRTEDFNIKEIYIDGRMIQKSSNSAVKSLANAAKGNTDAEIFKIFEDAYKQSVNKDNFMVLRLQLDESLFQFEMSFSESDNQFTYSITNPSIQFDSKNDEFFLNNDKKEITFNSLDTGLPLEGASTMQIKSSTYQISKITDQLLETISDFIFLVDGQEVRLVIEEKRVPYIPDNRFVKRVKNEFEISIGNLPTEN
jgi:hypothetical protein